MTMGVSKLIMVDLGSLATPGFQG